MNAISFWGMAGADFFSNDLPPALFTTELGAVSCSLYQSADCLWLLLSWKKGGRMAVRLVYAPSRILSYRQTIKDKAVSLLVKATGIEYHVQLSFDEPGIRYTTSVTAKADLFIPFYPRDLLMLPSNGKVENTAGQIHAQQVGTRSGLLYCSMTRPKTGSLLYLQNLTALNDYCQFTETACKEVVGGTWPELGFQLPAAKEKPLPAGKKVVIADAIIVLDAVIPVDEKQQVRQYLDMLSRAYLLLPLPPTTRHDWPKILDNGLEDLMKPGCWSQFQGHPYINAYVCDYETPPEIMVQLAALLPIIDYMEWSGKDEHPIIDKLKGGLSNFYNKDLKTIMRWLPGAEEKLKGDEEQKKPGVMDAWYLHHPLLNLSRMALKGDKNARQLFLDSIGYSIKVARKFKYQWPVFYDMKTLAVLKEETEPGKKGEQDVAGLYAHIMIQAYEITRKRRYLNEAEKAARTLRGRGFDLFYQANNTTFSAGALLRLFKITGKAAYLELSYLCLANVFKNVKLWDCNYGNGKHFPSFFALFPLSNAPYTAVYEEQEVFCALHEYLQQAEGVEILPSVQLLIAEFMRFFITRAPYYYPPMLPPEVFAEKVKMGEVDQKSWIALEDLHDGWEKNGEVGQEVYGAGNAFGILPRQCLLSKDKNFQIFIDYPFTRVRYSTTEKIALQIKGSPLLACTLQVIPLKKKPARSVRVYANRRKMTNEENDKNGIAVYKISGGQQVVINF